MATEFDDLYGRFRKIEEDFEDDDFEDDDFDEYEDEETPEQGPQPEDLMYADTGTLGTQYALGAVEGKYVGTFNTYKEVVDAIEEYTTKNNFHPDIWYQDDHGGIRNVSKDVYDEIRGTDKD